MLVLDVLRGSKFGQRIAEDERHELKRYFVETESWQKVFSGEVDVIYGAKGSGKSAIYSLILESRDTLISRGIHVCAAENPQGTPAFQGLVVDPPSTEFEFISLWKLYIVSLIASEIRYRGYVDDKSAKLIRIVEDSNLIPAEFSLERLFKRATDYVKNLRPRVSSIEMGAQVDPMTGMPLIKGKIIFAEPTFEQEKLGIVSIRDLLNLANESLQECGYNLWLLFDRLDVAFSDKPDLEGDALRSLFKCYLDIKSLNNINMKIFLRTDIWDQITRQGFREASHVERSITLQWGDDDILNLIVRRCLSNEMIKQKYKVDESDILSSFSKQQTFFQMIFPNQVDSGPNKPLTLKWILGRMRDAIQSAAPREVIHFLNELRVVQVRRLERGLPSPTEGRLFEQISFKEALPQVSKVRLEQTLYAEYPDIRPYVEKLRSQKAQQNVSSLKTIWGDCDIVAVTTKLQEIGFFEKVGSGDNQEFKVPFLYRPALSLVQGAADM